MIDVREDILVRLQACLKTLVPGVVYTFPGGVTHRPILTDLKGNVFTKARPEPEFDASELPAVELLTNPGAPDEIEIADEDTYIATLKTKLFGYVRSDDAGDDKDAPVRRKLNELRADIIVCMEAFPYWTSADYPEPITRRVGRISMVLESQFTEPAIHAPDGYLTLDYGIRHLFTRLDP